MGISFSNAAMMARAKKGGAKLDEILTIGHLECFLSHGGIAKLCEYLEVTCDIESIKRDRFSDTFFSQLFGTRTSVSLDISGHENCDIIHDMNHPVDPAYHGRFDAVIDGGSLEHIFNFPTALANCMQMVREGGSLFVFSMANNCMGHGFYQFSPDLFFRTLNHENGYEIIDVVLEEHSHISTELSPRTRCFAVTDPKHIGSRVGLVSKNPVTVMVHAIRRETKPIFDTSPIQSGYNPNLPENSRINSEKKSRSVENISLGLIVEKALRFAQGLHDSKKMAGYCWFIIEKFRSVLPTRLINYLENRRQLKRFSLSNDQFYRQIRLP